MNWRKLGKLFDPRDHKLPMNCVSHAQSPQALVLEDRVRIYFSSRSLDSQGKFLSRVLYVDCSKDLKEIIGLSPSEVIPLGETGTFDEHGIFPFSPIKVKDRLMAYTCGWSRRSSVPVETSTGIVYSKDGGNTFLREYTGPILTSSLQEPCLVGDSFVIEENGTYHMWYIFGKKWIPASQNEPPARVYKIAQASSADGINWKKQEGKAIITDLLGSDECQALPTVIKVNDRYHMYFCFREATDFRINPSRGYQLGYAYSDDLKHWVRDDDNKGISKGVNDWDDQMMCYPNLFRVDQKVYLLYNGNKFGENGFGIAILEND